MLINIYSTLKLNKKHSIENYLKYEKKDKNDDDVISSNLTIEELKKVHNDYHNYNYYRFNNIEERGKYLIDKEYSLYASILMKINKMAEIKEEEKK